MSAIEPDEVIQVVVVIRDRQKNILRRLDMHEGQITSMRIWQAKQGVKIGGIVAASTVIAGVIVQLVVWLFTH